MKEVKSPLNHLQAIADSQGSYISRATLPVKASIGLDELSPQEAKIYLDQRKVFDQLLLQPSNAISKLSSEH